MTGAEPAEPLTDLPADLPTDAPVDPSVPIPVGVPELEALLFVAERPLSRRELATLTGLRTDELDGLLGDLEVALRERGIRLTAVGERVQLTTAPETGALIARYTGATGARLSPSSLETLAIVAYRQPVTRGLIERIRGVDSDYVLRSLLHRRLIAEQGRAETPGRPILYGTTFEFMERFGLTSLEDLPPLDTDTASGLQAAADIEMPTEGEGPPGSERTSAAEPEPEAAGV
jgi:segregation and condensation protein B